MTSSFNSSSVVLWGRSCTHIGRDVNISLTEFFFLPNTGLHCCQKIQTQKKYEVLRFVSYANYLRVHVHNNAFCIHLEIYSRRFKLNT